MIEASQLHCFESAKEPSDDPKSRTVRASSSASAPSMIGTNTEPPKQRRTTVSGVSGILAQTSHSYSKIVGKKSGGDKSKKNDKKKKEKELAVKEVRVPPSLPVPLERASDRAERLEKSMQQKKALEVLGTRIASVKGLMEKIVEQEQQQQQSSSTTSTSSQLLPPVSLPFSLPLDNLSEKRSC